MPAARMVRPLPDGRVLGTFSTFSNFQVLVRSVVAFSDFCMFFGVSKFHTNMPWSRSEILSQCDTNAKKHIKFANLCYQVGIKQLFCGLYKAYVYKI